MQTASDAALTAERETAAVLQAYGRGCVEFMGIEILVEPGALVPRPETELLGQVALKVLADMSVDAPRVVDVCCGVGNLACAIAHHAPTARVWACDLTDSCAGIARRNLTQLKLEQRMSVHQGDLFGALDGLGLEGTIDVVVCNPPYISESRLRGDRAHLPRLEPIEAFAAGPYGMSCHLRVISAALGFLKPGGTLLMEIGLGQDRQVAKLFQRSGAYGDVMTVPDGNGNVRAVYASKRHGV